MWEGVRDVREGVRGCVGGSEGMCGTQRFGSVASPASWR